MKIDNKFQTDIKKEVRTNDFETTKERTAETAKTEEMPMNTGSDKKIFTAISKDGDTLELGSKMNDATLAKYSKVKLKQLLSSGQITQQQYAKAMKKLK